jgi:hypothetical protein
MVRPTIFATPVVLTALICIATPAGAAAQGGRSRGGASVGRAAPRASAPRGSAVPRVGGRVGVFAPYRFASPYYAFRPRVSVGFGLWVGFPVAYPYYAYGYGYPYSYSYGYPYSYGPYGYASPYPYPYPAPGYGYPSYGPPASAYPPANYPPPAGSVGVQPGQGESGGVSFETTPATASVYIDGQYAGTVADFSPTTQPLTLSPGRHQVEVRAPGYKTMALDIDVTPGQVIPFQGTMEPIRP